jgi:hypothetical protein
VRRHPEESPALDPLENNISQRGTEIILPGGDGKTLQLYGKMQAAIAARHSIDDCKAIADQA